MVGDGESAGVGHSLQQAPGRSEHGVVIVGEREGEASIPIGSGVTEVTGDERTRIVVAHDGDHPLVVEDIVRGERYPSYTRRRRQGQIHP